MKRIIFIAALFCLPVICQAATWVADITKLQAEGIDDPYNVIYPNMDITDSACARSNDEDRLAIKNEIQFSAALAAVMAGKTVKIHGSGTCNTQDFEVINFIMIFSDR
jgi:hypothetical protein